MLFEEKNGPDKSSPKQWFVLVDDRYRGPYTHRQIVSTIQQGGLAGANLIWKEGLADWTEINQVSEFSTADSGWADGQLSHSALSFLDHLEEEEDSTIIPPPVYTDPMPMPTPAPTPRFEVPAPIPHTYNTDFWLPETKHKKAWWKKNPIRLAVVLAAGFTFSLSLYLFTRSGFPVLKDLGAREAQELRSAAAEDPVFAGDTAAVVLVPGNLREPRFYIGANSADGGAYDVKLQGLGSTMAGAFYYSSTMSVKIKDNFAKTPAFHQENGKPLVPGEYVLTIFKNDAQITQKTFFLGGAKDAAYLESLKAYQSRIRVQAESELSEIRQVAELLEKQFNETNQRFKTRRAWDRFHNQWLALQDQIEIMFKGLNAEILNKEFYHGPLYGLLGETAADVSRLHNEQNMAVSLGTADPQKLGDISRAAQGRLLTLRAKLLQSERQTGI